jgi:hypothetical protein
MWLVGTVRNRRHVIWRNFSTVKPTRCNFVFSLLWINSIYMFQALLAYHQEALHKQQLVYCVGMVSAGCYQSWSGTGVGWTDTSSTPTLVESSRHNKHAIYQLLFVQCSWSWASSAQNMYRLLIHNKLNTKNPSRWFYCTDILRCTLNKTWRNFYVSVPKTLIQKARIPETFSSGSANIFF